MRIINAVSQVLLITQSGISGCSGLVESLPVLWTFPNLFDVEILGPNRVVVTCIDHVTPSVVVWGRV